MKNNHKIKNAVQAEMPMIANENKLWKIKFLPNFCQILDF